MRRVRPDRRLLRKLRVRTMSGTPPALTDEQIDADMRHLARGEFRSEEQGWTFIASVVARAKQEERERIMDALESLDSNDFAWRGMDVNTGMWAARFIRRGCELDPIGGATDDDTD